MFKRTIALSQMIGERDPIHAAMMISLRWHEICLFNLAKLKHNLPR